MVLEIDRQNRLHIEPIDNKNSYRLYLNNRENRTFQIENVVDINSDLIERKLADILIISHYLEDRDDIRYLVFTVKDSELIQLEDDEKHIYDIDVFSLSDKYLYLILRTSNSEDFSIDSSKKQNHNFEDSLVKFDKDLKTIQTLFSSEMKIEKPVSFKGKTVPFLILSSRDNEEVHHIYSVTKDDIICRNIPSYDGCRYLLEKLTEHLTLKRDQQIQFHNISMN